MFAAEFLKAAVATKLMLRISPVDRPGKRPPGWFIMAYPRLPPLSSSPAPASETAPSTLRPTDPELAAQRPKRNVANETKMAHEMQLIRSHRLITRCRLPIIQTRALCAPKPITTSPAVMEAVRVIAVRSIDQWYRATAKPMLPTGLAGRDGGDVNQTTRKRCYLVLVSICLTIQIIADA